MLRGRLKALVFDGTFPTPELHSAIAEADAALVSIPPAENGDPVLRAHSATLWRTRATSALGRLSVDDRRLWRSWRRLGRRGNAAAAGFGAQPRAARGRTRLARSWRAPGIAVAVLRLAGIYGPGQNALMQIARGNARRIVKPGQVFNRIHVGDIAQAIDAAFARTASGIFNVADDEPTPPGDPIVFAAQLMGVDAAAGTSVRRSGAVHVADGAELLAGMPPGEQRQAQTRTRRELALSDLSRRICARCSRTRVTQ